MAQVYVWSGWTVLTIALPTPKILRARITEWPLDGSDHKQMDHSLWLPEPTSNTIWTNEIGRTPLIPQPTSMPNSTLS